MADKECSDYQGYSHLASVQESKNKCFFDEKCMGVTSMNYYDSYYSFCPVGADLQFSNYNYFYNKTGSLFDFNAFRNCPRINLIRSFMIHCLNRDTNVISEVVVDMPSDGCPMGAYGCFDLVCPNSCYCEDHCSWKKCKLEDPPEGCLIHSDREWFYDEKNRYWKANLKGKFATFS